MAFYFNEGNVFSYCIVKRSQIFLLQMHDSTMKSHILECPVLQSPKSDPVNDHHVTGAAVSRLGNFLCACDSSNLLHLWEHDGETWNHHPERQLARKCQKIIFTNSGSDIIVADRSGDVFSYSALEPRKEGKFLLGHTSLIIDITISSDDNYLLTCDRDGKIRISCYPNSYNIHSYCLGHEEFVSSVQCLDVKKNLVLSSSGDGSVALWDFCGRMVSRVNLFDNELLCEDVEALKSEENSKSASSCLLDEKQSAFAVKSVRYSPKINLLAVLFYSIKGVAIYRIAQIKTDFKFEYLQFISTESIPFDLVFDLAGNLAILQKNADEQFTFLKYNNEGCVCFKAFKLDVSPLFNELQKLCGNIENMYESLDNCEFLFKRNFDDREDNVEINAAKKCKVT